jgi:glycosyltransferase involved in cell wall biosynthesis
MFAVRSVCEFQVGRGKEVTRPVHIKQSIVIPAYNESGRLGHTLESVADYLAKERIARDEFEVIVVCDGCRDGTERIAKSFCGRLPLRVDLTPVIGQGLCGQAGCGCQFGARCRVHGC